MKFVLLFVALNQQLAQLGTYNTEQICKDAIRTIYTTRAIDTQLQFQQEYVCVSKK